MEGAGGGRFATTRWSLVLAAGRPGTPGGDEALARLCELYWYPVFAFIRRRGYPAADAQDLAQGFFARLIEKGDVASADRGRGRFRSFLLAACQHFLANEQDRAAAAKRGGGQAPLSMDAAAAEQRYARALAHDETPERLYERQWCLAVLDGALAELREDCEAAGRAALFDRLKPFLAAEEDAGSHAAAAADLGMTPGAVKVAVHRLRGRYRAVLRRRVAETVSSDADVDDELRHLFRALGAGP